MATKAKAKAKKKSVLKHPDLAKVYLKYKVCISGAADTTYAPKGTIEKAIKVGREIAKSGAVLMTGATTGIPFWAAKGAKEAGGIVIGFSPAASKVAHIKTYHLPIEYHDLIVYTGFDYSGRNLILTRSADAMITIYGRVGTLNEFTIAFEDKKPQGVLEGSGGESDELKHILKIGHRGMGKVIFNKDPKALVKKVLAEARAVEKKVTLKDLKLTSKKANG